MLHVPRRQKLTFFDVDGQSLPSDVLYEVRLTTKKGWLAWTLLKEARIEIRKVVWPTSQETGQTTLMVVGIVLLVGLILWILDALLSWGLSGTIG